MPFGPSRLLSPAFAALLFAAAASAAAATPSHPANLIPSADTATASACARGQQQDPMVHRERLQALVRKYLYEARKLRENGTVESRQAAQTLLLKAKEYATGDDIDRVVRMLTAVQAELGMVDGTPQTLAEAEKARYDFVVNRLRTLTQQKIQTGKEAMADKNFSGAEQEFLQALKTMEEGVYKGMDWGGLADEAVQLLKEARASGDEQRTEARAAEQQELHRLMRQQDSARTARVRAQVDSLLAAAVRAFEFRQFRKASDLALSAQDLDPSNPLAEDLHNASLKAAKDDSQSRYYNQKAKEVRAMLESYEDLKIPQTDILRVDMAVFNRARRRIANTIPKARTTEVDMAVLAKAREVQVGQLSISEESGDYTEVVRTLQDITLMPIIITPAGTDVISSEGLNMQIEMTNSISLANFLDLMTSRSENLVWRVRRGVIQFTDQATAGEDNILHTYDVKDLVFPRTTFVAPTIRDIPSDDTGSGDVSRTGGELDDKVAFVELDTLMQNVQDGTGPEFWDSDINTIDVNENGFLVVKANAELHAKVGAVLADMRRFTSSVVTIDSKFLTVERNFLQEVGVDFRGLGGTGNKGTVATLDDITNGLQNNASRGLDNGGTGDPAANPSAGAFFNDGGDGDVRGRTENFFTQDLGRALTATGGLTASLSLLDDLQLNAILRAVEKRENSEIVNSQILTVLNRERGHVAVINQTAYIRDFDVEVAQASFIADPKVDVIQDGIVLDVRPVISHDRRFITLSLQPTVAELTRPIPTFTTSLAGSTLPVTLQLPNLTVTTFATTVKIPDGGSVLIGGLRQVLTMERRAEVPLLANLPLISFLFKNEGVIDESRTLMVMVQAWITDVHDVADWR